MEELAKFIERHTHGVIPAERCLTLFQTVISGPEAIHEIRVGGERQAVAVLIDTCESEGNAAELTFVCPGGERDLLDELLAWGVERLKAGKRSQIDVPQWRENLVPEDWIKSRGFGVGYTMYQMERASPAYASPGPLPTDWQWREFEKIHTDAFHATLKAAFLTVPGAFVPELPAFRERVFRYPIKPELLFDGDKVAGFVRVETRENGEGELTILGRHPQYRGQRLGGQLIARGLARLQSLGATKFHLEVVATNKNAITLYESFGFRTKAQTPVFRCPLQKVSGYF